MEKAEHKVGDLHQGRLLITGHRGMGVLEKPRDSVLSGVKFFPENSIAAFEEAILKGVPAVECDIHVSKDSKAIVIHGSKLLSYSDFIGHETERKIEHEIEQLTAAEISSNYALKGSDELFDRKNKEEKREIIKNKGEFQKVIERKKESHLKQPGLYKVPTFEEMLNAVAKQNKTKLSEGSPLVKINIELKGKRSGLASMRTIKNFYEKDPQNRKLLPPESLIFLGRREVGEVCLVNAIINNSDSKSIKDTILDERYVQYKEDFDSLMEKNLSDGGVKTVTTEGVREHIKEKSGYKEAARVHENLARLFENINVEYSGELYGQECQLLTTAFIEAGGNYQSLPKILLADPKEPFDRTEIPENLRSEFEKVVNLTKKELKIKSTEILKAHSKFKDVNSSLSKISNHVFYNSNNLKNSTEPIQLRQAPSESDYKDAYMQSAFKKLQIDNQFTDQVRLYIKEDEGKTKPNLFEQEKFLESYSTSLKGVRTNIMLTTGQLFSSEAVNLKSGDFDVKSKFKDISESGKEHIRSSIIDYKYDGIDCSIYDVTDELINVFNKAVEESGKKPSDFSLGLTASNWKGSKKENSPVTLDFTIAKGKIIAKKTGVDVLLKYDEPDTALLIAEMLEKGDVSSLGAIHNLGLQEVDVGFVKAFASSASSQNMYEGVGIERNNIKPPREEEKRLGAGIFSPEALSESDRVQRAFKQSFRGREVPKITIEGLDKAIQDEANRDPEFKERMGKNLLYDMLVSEENIEHEVDKERQASCELVRQASCELFKLSSNAYKTGKSVDSHIEEYRTLRDSLTDLFLGENWGISRINSNPENRSVNLMNLSPQISEPLRSLPFQINLNSLGSFDQIDLNSFNSLSLFEACSSASIPSNEEGFDFGQGDTIKMAEQVKEEVNKIVDDITSGKADDLAESAKKPANLQKGQGFSK